MKKRLSLFPLFIIIFLPLHIKADISQVINNRTRWLKIAEECKPELHKRVVKPVAVVKAIKDEKAYQGWRYEKTSTTLNDFYKTSFKNQKEITLDFGEHLTGFCTIHIKKLNRPWDAPSRLKMTFAEIPAELNTPFDPWKGGLSRGWMQDQTVEILEDDMDNYITIRRRLSMRYLKIELLGSSAGYDFAIDEINFESVTSAGELKTTLNPDAPQIYKDPKFRSTLV